MALVGDEFYPGVGGVASYTLELGRALAELGAEPVVITHAWPGHPPEEEVEGVKALRLEGFVIPGISRALSVRLGRELHRLIKFGGFDVVHGQDIFSTMALQSVYSARRCKLPSVLTCHSVHGFSGFWKFTYKPITLTMRKAARVIAVSSPTAEFCRALGVQPERIRVILNGCTPVGSPLNPRSVRRKFGMGDGPLIVSVLRLVKKKGPQYLIQALPKIKREVAQAKLAVVGEGREKPALKKLARELGVEDSVWFLGSLPRHEVLTLVAAADVFVLPSEVEACPLALLESIALGTPAVCTRVGGIPELIEDGLEGLVVPPADPQALAEAVVQVLKDGGLAERVRANELRAARGRLSWRRAAQQTLEVYEEALKHAKGSAYHRC